MDHVKRDEKNVNIVVYLFIYFYNKRVQWISFKDLKDLNLKSWIICQSKIRDTVKILVTRLIDGLIPLGILQIRSLGFISHSLNYHKKIKKLWNTLSLIN